MKVIYADKISKRVVDLLISFKNKREIGTVHSIFKNSINILLSSNSMITLQSDDVIITPLSISLKFCPDSLQNIGFQVGENVWWDCDSSTIMINNLSVNILKAEQYDGYFDYSKNMKIHHKSDLAILKTYRQTDDFVFSNSIAKSSYIKCFLATENLSKAVELADENKAKEAVYGLVGLGQGLTPTGDDMLLGFLSTACLFKKHREFIYSLKEYILKTVKERSTDISYEFIRCMFDFEYSQPIKDILCAVLDGDKKRCSDAAKQLLSFGSSSGRDCLYGMAVGMELLW